MGRGIRFSRTPRARKYLYPMGAIHRRTQYSLRHRQEPTQVGTARAKRRARKVDNSW